ncbi:MAG: magnesium transporter [Planctomycetota bacterium]
MDEPRKEDWKELEGLIERGDAGEISRFLDELPLGETARLVDRLDDTHRSRLLLALEPDRAAAVMDQIPEARAAVLLEAMPADTAAAILEVLPSDEQVDLMSYLPEPEQEAILQAMDPEWAADARALAKYPDEVAGGLMIAEYLSYPQSLTVNQVVEDLRANQDEYRGYNVQYAYVTDNEGVLVGVLRLRDLLLASPRDVLTKLMIQNPVSVIDDTSLDGLRDFFERHRFLGVPVVDPVGRLVGVVESVAVEAALSERAGSDYLKAQGIVGGEELRSMPIAVRSRRRLAWLSANIVLNVGAASVIAYYQDTLSQVIALAVFLPMISDMSGCSGNQAVAVSMRELSLGLVKPSEVFRVWRQEIAVGVLNGLVLGLLIAGVAWVWQGSAVLGAVVGAALAMNTVVAVSVGGTLPLVLRKVGVDPALASGPLLTTLTDVCGFFLALTLASAALPYLTAG